MRMPCKFPIRVQGGTRNCQNKAKPDGFCWISSHNEANMSTATGFRMSKTSGSDPISNEIIVGLPVLDYPAMDTTVALERTG